jgi:hypothetical protein
VKKNLKASATAMTLLTALAIPVRLAAQERLQEENKEHTRYKLVDIGTFGGPTSTVPGPDFGPSGSAKSISNRGTVAGSADTAISDPDGFFIITETSLLRTRSRGRTVSQLIWAHSAQFRATTSAMPVGSVRPD